MQQRPSSSSRWRTNHQTNRVMGFLGTKTTLPTPDQQTTNKRNPPPTPSTHPKSATRIRRPRACGFCNPSHFVPSRVRAIKPRTAEAGSCDPRARCPRQQANKRGNGDGAARPRVEENVRRPRVGEIIFTSRHLPKTSCRLSNMSCGGLVPSVSQRWTRQQNE